MRLICELLLLLGFLSFICLPYRIIVEFVYSVFLLLLQLALDYLLTPKSIHTLHSVYFGFEGARGQLVSDLCHGRLAAFLRITSHLSPHLDYLLTYGIYRRLERSLLTQCLLNLHSFLPALLLHSLKCLNSLFVEKPAFLLAGYAILLLTTLLLYNRFRSRLLL